MMNRNFQQKYESEQQEMVEEKTFNQGIFSISYVNTSKINEQETDHCGNVKVNNYLCRQDGNFLIKVTEILYEGKIITIEDKFHINTELERTGNHLEETITRMPNKKRNTKEKLRIFASEVNKNMGQTKKDKKNIVKNLVKMFFAWAQKKIVEQHANPDVQKQLKTLISKEKFNNRLIMNIIQNNAVSKYFYEFLTQSAEEQIKYSRIQDKESHYEVVKIYTNLLIQNSFSKDQENSDSFPSYPRDEDFQHHEQGQNLKRQSSEKQTQKVLSSIIVIPTRSPSGQS